MFKMDLVRFILKTVVIASAFSVGTAWSAPATLTYQGRIIRADGTPLQYSSVSFIFQITDPSGQCVVFQEQVDGINMVNSGGVFDVPIGGGVVQYPLGGPASVLDAFKTSNVFTCGTCSLVAGHYVCSDSSSTYTAVSGDARKLRVSFYDGNGWKIISPDSVVRTVPYAAYSLSAEKLGSNVASDFVTKVGLPNCNSGEFLTWNGTSLSCAAVAGTSGGTVTNVFSANAYLTITNGASIPSLAVNVGQVANTLAAGNDNRIVNALQTGAPASGDLSGTYPSPMVAKISGTALLVSSLSSGNYLKYNGTNWINATPSSADLSDSSSLIKTTQMPANCSAGQTLIFSSPTGAWTCVNIAVTASNFGAQNANTFLAGPTTGNATPAFRNLVSTDLPSGVATTGTYNSVTVDTYGRVTAGTNPTTVAGYGITDAFVNGGNSFGGAANLGTNDNNALGFKTNNSTRMTISAAGNVGIGTATPAYPLDLQSVTTATASSNVALQNLSLTANPGADSAVAMIGSILRVQSTADASNYSKNFFGSKISVSHNSTGTVSSLTGQSASVTSSGQAGYLKAYDLSVTGNATDAYGISAAVGGTFTNAYGIYTGLIQGTNRWSIYASDATTPSYFAGNVGIGTTNPSQTLTVAGTIQSTSGGIMFPDGTTQTTSAPMTKWASAGAAVIGADTTVPTKGTTTIDKLLWRRVNDTMEINWNMVMSGAGSSGSGYYLLTIPGGYAIDTTKLSVPSSAATPMAGVGTIGIVYSAGAGNCTGTVYAYNATQLFANLICFNGGTGSGAWGSSYLNFTMTQNVNIKASFPISGW